jgi:formamidopyrimidine-DNA glycosylase
LVAGIGNIYASEALFRAGVAPKTPSRRLQGDEIDRLWHAIRDVLCEAIELGSTVPLNYGAARRRDNLFYFGRAPETPDFYTERLLVYDRAALPCTRCGVAVKRITQAGRSTFFCPQCQRRPIRKAPKKEIPRKRRENGEMASDSD